VLDRVIQEGVLEKEGVNNTYLSATEACFRSRRFPIEIIRPGSAAHDDGTSSGLNKILDVYCCHRITNLIFAFD
jgi:hypothetical protein